MKVIAALSLAAAAAGSAVGPLPLRPGIVRWSARIARRPSGAKVNKTYQIYEEELSRLCAGRVRVLAVFAGCRLRAARSPHMTDAAASGPAHGPSADLGQLETGVPIVTHESIDHLRRWFERTRLPERETVTDMSQGIPVETMSMMISLWLQHD